MNVMKMDDVCQCEEFIQLVSGVVKICNKLFHLYFGSVHYCLLNKHTSGEIVEI